MLHMDYHVHCKNSPDSSEPLDEICQGAVDAGLTEIMVTDRYSPMIMGVRRLILHIWINVWIRSWNAEKSIKTVSMWVLEPN